MSKQPRTRQHLPAGSPDTKREEIRKLRDSIKGRAKLRRTAQTARLNQAQLAATTGTPIQNIVEATGLSRTYLHRAGIRADHTANTTTANTALDTARQHRDTLAALDTADRKDKAQRRLLTLELLDIGAGLSEKDLAADAGVTAEWVRRRFTDV